MSPRGTLRPLTLLLLSLLCYGFVMVWTEKATLETTPDTEDPTSSSLDPVVVNVKTGENLSVSVPPSDGFGVPTTDSTRVGSTTESTTTPLPVTASGVTSPVPSTVGSLSSGVPTGGTDTPASAMPAVDETSANSPQSTSADNTSENPRSGSPSGMLHQAGSCSPPKTDGSGADGENCTSPSSGTVTATNDPDTVTTGTGEIMELEGSPLIPRTVKRTTYPLHHDVGGRLSWRVRLQSSLTREDAITAFFQETCDMIQKIPHMEDIVITWGPERTEMACHHQMDEF